MLSRTHQSLRAHALRLQRAASAPLHLPTPLFASQAVGLAPAPQRFLHSSSHCCSRPHGDDDGGHQHRSPLNPRATPLELERVLSHLEIMEQWTCSGCGIEMQHEDASQVGYFPKQLLTSIVHMKDLKKLRCERCFQMTQYGKISDAKMPYQEYEKRVMELRAKDLLMLQLVDVLDISGSLLPKARHVFGNKPVMLIVNKGDLIPERSGIRRLMRRIRNEAKCVPSVHSVRRSIGWSHANHSIPFYSVLPTNPQRRWH